MALGIMNSGQWKFFVEEMGKNGGILLAAATAGVGLGTSFSNLRNLGLKPFLVGTLTAFAVGVASLVATFVLGPYLKL